MIIVTGGAGFIGTNLVRSLIESEKEILIVEELDRYTKKFENIKNLEILLMTISALNDYPQLYIVILSLYIFNVFLLTKKIT